MKLVENSAGYGICGGAGGAINDIAGMSHNVSTVAEILKEQARKFHY